MLSWTPLLKILDMLFVGTCQVRAEGARWIIGKEEEACDCVGERSSVAI